jgi:hypothetical protein
MPAWQRQGAKAVFFATCCVSGRQALARAEFSGAAGALPKLADAPGYQMQTPLPPGNGVFLTAS